MVGREVGRCTRSCLEKMEGMNATLNFSLLYCF
jgi:hypothetical protein